MRNGEDTENGAANLKFEMLEFEMNHK